MDPSASEGTTELALGSILSDGLAQEEHSWNPNSETKDLLSVDPQLHLASDSEL